jgi:hypothetical protein
VAGAGLVIPVLTRRAMRFPPSGVLGLALATLLVLSLLGRARVWRWIDPLLAAALAVASVAQYLLPGIVWGHDTKDHLWGAYGYLEAWRAGDFLPIWLHHLGVGQPMPLFYGPLGFWAMAPAALAGAGPRGMFAASIVLASVVAALAAGGAVLCWTRDRRAALVAAVALTFAPYRLCDANYRSGVGESWAVALFPLALYAFHRLLTRGSRRDFVLASLSTAAMAFAHPLSLVMLALLLPVLWARLWSMQGSRPSRALARAANASAAAVGGLLLAGFFTIPLLAEKKYLDLDEAIPSHEGYTDEAAFARQLVDRQLWDKVRYSEPASTEKERPDQDMPFYLGVVGLAAIVTAMLAARSQSRSARIAGPMGLLGTVAAAGAILPFAAWVAAIPGIRILQFPWRFLGPASAAAALAVGLLVARARGARASRFLAAAAALALLADGFAFSGTVCRVPAWQGLGIYHWLDAELAATESVPKPWSARVAGSFLPPAAKDADVGYVAQVEGDYLALPYREYFTPAMHQLAAHDRDWRHLAVGQVGWTLGTLERVKALPYARFRPDSGFAARGVPYRRAAGRIEVTTPETGGELRVAEQYFPGWQVRTGNSWQEVLPQADGFLGAQVPMGVRRVEFRFDRWRTDRLLGWLASGVTLALLGIMAFGRGRARPSAPVAPGG